MKPKDLSLLMQLPAIEFYPHIYFLKIPF